MTNHQKQYVRLLKSACLRYARCEKTDTSDPYLARQLAILEENDNRRRCLIDQAYKDPTPELFKEINEMVHGSSGGFFTIH